MLIGVHKILAVNTIWGAVPRFQLVNIGMQLYARGRMTWSTKTIILRNPAYHTIDPIGAGAARWRVWTVLFGSLAHREALGTRGKEAAPYPGRKVSAGTMLPAPAALMMRRAREIYRMVEARLPARKATYDPARGRYVSRRTPKTLEAARAEAEAMIGAERLAEILRTAGLA